MDKKLLFALCVLSAAVGVSLAIAQTPPPPPLDVSEIALIGNAPASSEDFQTREAWCGQYVDWYLRNQPAPEGGPPSDARPTGAFETEATDCKRDPHLYQQNTETEMETARTHSGTTG